jgi:hypothetical protein
METRHNISNTRNKSHIDTRVRTVVTLVGMVIAIMCSVVLLTDLHAAGRVEASVPEHIETKNFVKVDLLIKLKNIAAASTKWSFK